MDTHIKMVIIATLWWWDWLVFAEAEVATAAAATTTVTTGCNATDQEQRLKRIQKDITCESLGDKERISPCTSVMSQRSMRSRSPRQIARRCTSPAIRSCRRYFVLSRR
jgi:hypothetical protein